MRRKIMAICFIAALIISFRTAADSSANAAPTIDSSGKLEIPVTQQPVAASQQPAIAGANNTQPDTNGTDITKAFGLSVGLGIDFYTSLYVNTASTNGPNNIVSVDDSYRVLPSLWAVGTYIKDSPCAAESPIHFLCNSYVRPGGFFGVKVLDQTGSGITGVSLGLQLSLLHQTNSLVASGVNQPARLSTSPEPTWNIGVGWSLHKTQRLAYGIQESAPLPSEYSSIKYKTFYSSGVIIMISRSVL